jgi:HK97 gp10 family phage protein
MATTIHVSGVPEFDRSVAETVLAVNAAARRIVEKGGLMIASEAKLIFRGRPAGSQRISKKTGRVYFSYKPPYQAQPPRPTNRTGHLSDSIRIQAITSLIDGWMSLTGPSMFYAPYVEYGTSRQREEPFMATAEKRGMVRLEEIARSEWAKAVA